MKEKIVELLLIELLLIEWLLIELSLFDDCFVLVGRREEHQNKKTSVNGENGYNIHRMIHRIIHRMNVFVSMNLYIINIRIVKQHSS